MVYFVVDFILFIFFIMNYNKNTTQFHFCYLRNFILLFLFFLSGFMTQNYAQCRGVKMPVATLSVVERPCGPTASGIMTLEIKGGLAPYSLTWSADEKVLDSLSSTSNSGKLTIDNLKASMKPGYVVNIKDACENTTSATAQLIISVPIHFVNAPQVLQLVTNKDEPNGKLLVEVRGGNLSRSLVATDSKGKSFVQQTPVGPAEKGIFKYELNKLPAENYKVELKSGAQKCTQVWKETIEIKASLK
jgi:hypothetical protein